LVANGGRFAEMARAQFMLQETAKGGLRPRESDDTAVKA